MKKETWLGLLVFLTLNHNMVKGGFIKQVKKIICEQQANFDAKTGYTPSCKKVVIGRKNFCSLVRKEYD